MKIRSIVICLLSGILFFVANVVRAGVPDADALSAIEATDTIPSSSLPMGALYYSAANPNGPPMPGSMGYDAWQIDSNTFLLDDLDSSSGFSGRGMGMMDDSGPPGFGDVGDGGDYTNSYVSYTFDTNGLWLEITNVSNNWSYLNLHHATNQVYSIWSTTNLSLPFASGQVEMELWPTGDQTNVLPFAVRNFDRQNLFLRAEDWTGVDSDGDGIPDWWIWMYFGNLSETATNLDAGGNTLLSDYTNGIAPTVFEYTEIETTNNYFNSTLAPAQLNVSGSPYYIAISVDDTNYETDASWQAYSSSNVTVNLGSTEGWHEVRIGLRGHADDVSSAVWWRKRLKLDWTPPQITVTNAATMDIPLLQLRGFAGEDLDNISYDLSNAVVVLTNQDVNITDRFYDTNASEFTTNCFEALDISLTNGLNVVTIHATDEAGNVTVTNFSFTLDYSAKTNPPDVQVAWPQDGMQVCGNSFTLRGQVDDGTVSVSASMIDTNGNTNTFSGEVERDGRFWLENLPLNGGTNYLSLTVGDVVGNTTMTNISVVQSSLTLTMNPVSDSSQLWQPTINVGGTISDSTASVWVNGVQGTNNGDGTWSAANVPVTAGGVAIFDVKASSSGGGDSGVNTNADKPVRLYVESYTLSPWHQVIVDHEDDYSTTDGSLVGRNYRDLDIMETVGYGDGQPGGSHYDLSGSVVIYAPPINLSDNVDYFWDSYWPASTWPDAIFVDWYDSDGNYGEETDPPPGSYEIANNADMSLGSYHLYYTNGDTVVNRTSKDTESYDAQTVMKLQTGGKAVPRQNLFKLSASATQFHPGRYKPDGTTIDDVWTPIPPQSIQVDGLNLNTNGYIYKILSDNTTVDVTPKVSGVAYYTFSVGATKYLSHFEVFVDQPDPTGTHVWTHADAAGHAWWRIRTDAPSDAVNEFISSDLAHFLNDSVGYANTNTVNVYPWSPNAPGELRDPESDIYFSAYTNYDIGFPDLIGGLDYTKQLKDSPGTYNLWANNCVDKVIQAGAAAGVTVPNNKGPKAYSNPEFFGKSFQH